MPLSDKSWQKWLQSDGGQAFLNNCAKRILADFRCRRRVGQALGESSGSTELEGSLRDWQTTLVSELYLFIVENPSVGGALHGCVVQNDRIKAVAYLKRAFDQHVIDLLRKRSDRPWHGYYRNARTAIAQESGFTYWPTRRGSFFAALKLMGLPPPMIPEHLFANADYRQWPDPEPFSGGSRRAELVHWSRFFYAKARRLAGLDGLVPLRALVNYVLARGGLGWTQVDYLFLDAPNCPVDAVNGALTETSPILKPNSDTLRGLACQLFESWPDNWKEAFCRRFGLDQKLTEIAHGLGYAGPSGVSGIFALIKTSLKETMSAWPGLSPPDMHDDSCDAFMHMLLSLCKNAEKNRIG